MTPMTIGGTYKTYGLSLWRWVSSSLKGGGDRVRANLDFELSQVLVEAGLRQAGQDERPDLLLRYEAAPGVLIAELIDPSTDKCVWRTDLRGDLEEESIVDESGLTWRV